MAFSFENCFFVRKWLFRSIYYTTMSESYYQILGVEDNASQEEIKKAYRKLSLKLHPDRNKEADAVPKYQKINEAYETLEDPGRRKQYDMGQSGVGPGFVDINSLFSELFSGHGGPGIRIFHSGGGHGFPPFGQGPSFHPGTSFHQLEKPSPIIKNVRITMEQVYHGCQFPIEIDRWSVENGVKTFEKETLYIKIPKGVDDNEIIILRGKGNSLSEQCNGDIKIVVGVDNTTEFTRHGIDLIYEKSISLKESLCGVGFEIRHLNGKSYTIQNNKGNIISPGFTKMIPGLGLERDQDKGNLIIRFHVTYPEKLASDVVDKLAAIL